MRRFNLIQRTRRLCSPMRLWSSVAARLAALLLLAWGISADVAWPAQQGTTRVATTDHFEFHSDPWLNLHHFLYQWARADEGLGEGRQKVPVPERSSLDELGEDRRRAWLEAVAFYRGSVARRNHFDDDMLELKRRLRELGGDPRAQPPDVIPGISEALATAMPVYQASWWPEHDVNNRAWVAGVVPLLRRHEDGFAQLTTRIYGAEWPSEPFRADVSAYANWSGAYTAFGHIMLSSTHPRIQDLYALEMVFHEVQHSRAVGRPGRLALAEAFDAAGVEQPRNLWHALIFSTAGEFTRRVAEADGLPDHTPYWIREGFENFGGWSALVPAVNEHWLPVVRGEMTQEQGYAALVRIFESD